jgi:alkylhydroperoxidase family enzyme
VRVAVTPDQIRIAFEAVKDDPSFDESRGLWERGKPPVEMLQAMALRPEILRAFAGFGEAVYPGGIVERRVKELVIIAASQANECQFCLNAHCDIVEIEGFVVDEEPLRLLDTPDRMTPREAVAVAYTRAAMTDSNAVPDDIQRRLHELFTDAELVEVTFLVGYITMLNTFNNLLGVRYHGDYRALEEPVA